MRTCVHVHSAFTRCTYACVSVRACVCVCVCMHCVCVCGRVDAFHACTRVTLIQYMREYVCICERLYESAHTYVYQHTTYHVLGLALALVETGLDGVRDVADHDALEAHGDAVRDQGHLARALELIGRGGRCSGSDRGGGYHARLSSREGGRGCGRSADNAGHHRNGGEGELHLVSIDDGCSNLTC